MSDTQSSSSLPSLAIKGLVAYLVTEALYVPVVFGKLSVSLSLILAPFLIWSVARGSKLSGYFFAALLSVGVLLDMPLLLAALVHSNVSASGVVLLLAHVGISIALAGYILLSQPMKAFFAARVGGAFGRV